MGVGQNCFIRLFLKLSYFHPQVLFQQHIFHVYLLLACIPHSHLMQEKLLIVLPIADQTVFHQGAHDSAHPLLLQLMRSCCAQLMAP